ncbi:MAG: hypothetical protein M3537_09380 [Chloroflexota bacterium]|nr:hypothetical protein [Chloroflexota bacterium]
MYLHQLEALARLRSTELSRLSELRAERRSSLRIILDARRARRQDPSG